MADTSSWLVFGAVLGTFLVIDLFFVQRRRAALGMRTALGWVVVWVSVGLGFGFYVLYRMGGEAAGAYFAGYLIEYSLSADNVFVFAMLFAYFRVAPENQRLLLFWGVLGAIVFRAVFILGGIALIHVFEPTIYILGAVLVATGIQMARHRHEQAAPGENAVLRLLQRFLPVAVEQPGRAFVARVNGRLMATPLLAALIAIELSDIIFAVDSVPAILAITTDPFIVLTSNGFAILGLRSLYFLLAGALRRFVYLRLGLAAILVFAGAKMLLSGVVHVPVFLSLAVIGLILGGALGVSLLVKPRGAPAHEAQVEHVEGAPEQ
jgi:tellurite resistance protein TerC